MIALYPYQSLLVYNMEAGGMLVDTHRLSDLICFHWQSFGLTDCFPADR